MKTITIKLENNTTQIDWTDNMSTMEVLGILRYYEKHLFIQMHKDPIEKTEKEIYLRNLDLGNKAINVLESYNIKTIKDLSNYTLKELFKLRGLGKKSIDEIQYIFEKYKIN